MILRPGRFTPALTQCVLAQYNCRRGLHSGCCLKLSNESFSFVLSLMGEKQVRPTVNGITRHALNMNQERREQIAAALRQYREMVLQHNLFLLCTLVEKVEAQPAPPNYLESVAQELRMQAINELIEVPESIKLPRYVLDEGVISLLIWSASLEGVDNDPVDPSQRREYFAGLNAKIEERRVELAEFPPSDLEYPCTLVSGITGPGLPFH